VRGPGEALTVEQAILRRRSVRGFVRTELPEETLREIFALAQCAPSNCNIQPWMTHVLSGDSLRALARAMTEAADAGVPPDPDFIAERKFVGFYRERQFDAAMQLYGAMGIERQDRARRDQAYRRNLEFFGAPHAALVFMHRDFAHREAVDLGIYAQTLMLAMTARGLASCAQGALSLYPGLVRAHLKLDETHRLIFGISFGFEDRDVPANNARVGRAPLDQSVVFHR
jgi:nitroreductase